MPSLQFKGKTFVQNYHHIVKYHELIPQKEKSLTDNYSDINQPRNCTTEAWNNTNMRKTSIELIEKQYFFLKEKALEHQK